MAGRDTPTVVNNIVINLAELPDHVRELVLEHVTTSDAAVPSPYLDRAASDKAAYNRGYSAGVRAGERSSRRYDDDDRSYHN